MHIPIDYPVSYQSTMDQRKTIKDISTRGMDGFFYCESKLHVTVINGWLGSANSSRVAQDQVLCRAVRHWPTLLAYFRDPAMAFRKIDVDKYDEDQYGEDEILAEFETDISPQQHQAAVRSRGAEVRNLLQRYDVTQVPRLIQSGMGFSKPIAEKIHG